MPTEPIGKRRWAIAEGYIPPESTASGRALESHETACILNAGDTDAHVEITVFYSDRPRRAEKHRLDKRHRVRRADHRAAYAPRVQSFTLRGDPGAPVQYVYDELRSKAHAMGADGVVKTVEGLAIGYLD